MGGVDWRLSVVHDLMTRTILIVGLLSHLSASRILLCGAALILPSPSRSTVLEWHLAI